MTKDASAVLDKHMARLREYFTLADTFEFRDPAFAYAELREAVKEAFDAGRKVCSKRS